MDARTRIVALCLFFLPLFLTSTTALIEPLSNTTLLLGGGGSAMTDVVNDTSPELGGNLDVNGFNITSAADLNILGTDFLRVESEFVNIEANTDLTIGTTLGELLISGLGGPGVRISGELEINNMPTLNTVSFNNIFVLRQPTSNTVINDAGDDHDFRFATTGNANTLFIDAGTNNIGIGTGAPAYDLHVNTSTGFTIITAETTNTSAGAEVELINTLKTWKVQNRADGNFSITDGSTQRFIIDGNGRIGIGATAPSFGKLQVHQTVDSSSGGITVLDSGGTFTGRFWTDGANAYLYAGSTGQRNLTISGTGNVGIGTNTPEDNLHLNSTQATVRYTNSDATADFWRLGLNPNEDFVINHRGNVIAEMIIDQSPTGIIVAFNGNGTGASVGVNTSATGTNATVALTVNGEALLLGVQNDGSGKVVCIKADETLGTCTSAVNATGFCTCG